MPIRETLLRSLFTSPTTLYPEIYSRLRNQIFPGEQDFIDFLIENSEEKRTEIASMILLRLSYDLPLFSPNKFLFSVLSLETSMKSKTPKFGFVGRDHFVHLVNLYLLGLYLYFYHPGIQRHNYDLFLQKRRAAKTLGSKAEQELQIHGDFIFAWKVFAVLHDIGYPFEVAAGNKDLESSLVPFFHIKESFTRETAVSLLSKLLAYSRVFDGSYPVMTLSDEFAGIQTDSFEMIGSTTPMFDGEATSFETVLDSWKTATCLPALFGQYFVKTLGAIFDHGVIAAYLEDQNTGKPDIFIIYDDSRKNYIVFRNKDANDVSHIHKNIAIKMAFSEGDFPHPSHIWRYVIKIGKKDKYKDAVKDVLFCDLSKRDEIDVSKQLTLVSDYFDETTPLTKSIITTDSDIREYAFHIYRMLLKILSFEDASDDELDSYEIETQIQNSVIEATQPVLVKKIALEFENILRERVQKMNSDAEAEKLENPEAKSSSLHDLLLNETLEHTFKKIFGEWKYVKQIRELIYERLLPQISEEIEVKKGIHQLYECATDKITNFIVEPLLLKADNFDSQNKIIDFEKLNNLEGSDRIDQRLIQLGLPKISELYEVYRPPWLRPEQSDHGIASFYALQEFRNIVLQLIRHKDSDAVDPKAKSVSARIGLLGAGICAQEENAHSERTDLLYRLTFVSDESIFATLIHNISPIHLPDGFKAYRTDLTRSPFAYLAMLSDSLQCWDRPRTLNQGNRKLPYCTYGTAFDIQFRNNEILVREEAEELELSKRQNELRKHLDEYLKSASQLIRLTLGEWKNGSDYRFDSSGNSQLN